MSYNYHKLNQYDNKINYNYYFNISISKLCKWFLISLLFISLIFFLLIFMMYILTNNFQSRLSYTSSGKINDLTVTWSNIFKHNKNQVYLEYYKDDVEKKVIKVQPITTKYNKQIIPKYVHRANLNNLEYDSWYNYNLKTSTGYSETFKFKVPEKNDTDYKVLFFGDMGVTKAISRNQIIKNIKTYDYRYLFHVGDIAYNLQEKMGIWGDIYLSSMQEATSIVPYMVIPGNHESWDNFSNYIYRFSMPNYQKTNNFFYTIEQPPLKMINFNTETFYGSDYLKQPFYNQLDFITKELQNINRSLYPWVIATGHRPIYCSNKNNDDCTHWRNDKLRYLENLFFKYNLSIYLSAHEHSYERICPIYDGQCQEGFNKSSSFNNSKLQYPIHIISGAAGCREGHEKFKDTIPFWSVIRNRDSGYGILDVNYDRLKWYEYVVNENNQDTYLIDSLEILNQ